MVSVCTNPADAVAEIVDDLKRPWTTPGESAVSRRVVPATSLPIARRAFHCATTSALSRSAGRHCRTWRLLKASLVSLDRIPSASLARACPASSARHASSQSRRRTKPGFQSASPMPAGTGKHTDHRSVNPRDEGHPRRYDGPACLTVATARAFSRVDFSKLLLHIILPP